MSGVQFWLGVACAALVFGPVLPPGSRQAESAASPQNSRVTFALGGNAAEIPAAFAGNLIFLPVRVNDGVPSSFVLDTTAATSAVAPGRGDDARTPALQNPTLSFPGVQISLASLPIASRNDLETATGRQYRGTIGDDALSRIVLVLNYQRETAQMYDPASYSPARDATTLALVGPSALPVIRARFVVEKGKPIEGDFLLDTTIDASVVFSNAFAERHKMFSARVKTVSTADPELGADEKVALARMKAFEIGTSTMENLIGEFPRRGWHPAGDASLAGAIGGGILRRFTVALDLSRRQVHLEPNSHFADYDQEDKSGMALIAGGPGLKEFRVVDVQAGSPAATAGIQKGDLIAGVDGEPAADMTLAAVRELLRDGGYKRQMEMERSGKTYEVTVDLARLL